jgi:hypothetical protein
MEPWPTAGVHHQMTKESHAMRSLVLAAAALGFAIPAMAQPGPPPPPHFERGPVTEDFLRQLDNDQLRLLRRAIQGCPSASVGLSKAVRTERDPCVIASTDRAVADSDNPDLQAFHSSLPDSDRYDENRSSTVWRAWLRP